MPEDFADAPSLTLQTPATSPVALMADAQLATIQAHDAFLRFSTQLQQHHFHQSLADQVR